MFELTFLGTSSGVPTLRRNVSGLAVSLLAKSHQTGKSTPWILIDCGEATQHQLLRTPHKPSMLQAILITHMHGDHCYGLMGLLASLAMHGRTSPLPIIAPPALGELLDAFIRLTEMNLSYEIDFIDIHSVLDTGLVLELSDELSLEIDIHPLSHRCDSFGFGLTQIHRQKKLNTAKLSLDHIATRHWGSILKSDTPSLSIDGRTVLVADYLHLNETSQKIVIAGDNDTPSLLTDAVKGAVMLVHEATYTQAVMDKILAKGVFDPKHSSAKMVAKFARDAGVPCLVLTHFSARFMLFDDPDESTPNMGHIRHEAESSYEGKLILASDLMVVSTATQEGAVSMM
ncbi:ribonuclease Z [Moraxella porci]|uniref:ribonuclease Z n=1 Tax=Moraxella porci TaxID=1288392 RepID=UPI0024481419|nr:ribonuclease Z [Moraxella porci]MDH2272797.1 ribonuclease Z [Moraxella porci]